MKEAVKVSFLSVHTVNVVSKNPGSRLEADNRQNFFPTSATCVILKGKKMNEDNMILSTITVSRLLSSPSYPGRLCAWPPLLFLLPASA